MTEKPLETIGDVNAALKHLGWQNVDDLHYWAQGNDIERFERLVQAFATHRTEAVAALEADNAAHVRNTLNGYKVADELAAERDALQARVRELELDLAAKDALHDSAYIAGMKAGYRFGDSGDSEGFAAAIDSTDHVGELKRIAAARKALHAPR